MYYKSIPIIKLKIQNRNHIVSKLKSGDIIVTKSELVPLYVHHALIKKENGELKIVHLHPDKFNEVGGNLVIEPLNNWLVNGREIISIEQTKLDNYQIDKLYETLKEYKYDKINFNCEHFTNFAKGERYVSTQVYKYTAIALLGAFVFYLIKNKKI